MPEMKSPQMWIGRNGSLAVIRLAGRCTMALGSCLRRCLDRCRAPEVTDLFFDLAEADYLDSTCIGLVISLAFKKNDPSVPRIHLLNPSAGLKEVLATMHVLHCMDCQCELPVAVTEWEELPIEGRNRLATTNAIIEAHERLIQADPRNAAIFGPLVEELRACRDDCLREQNANPL